MYTGPIGCPIGPFYWVLLGAFYWLLDGTILSRVKNYKISNYCALTYCQSSEQFVVKTWQKYCF